MTTPLVEIALTAYPQADDPMTSMSFSRAAIEESLASTQEWLHADWQTAQSFSKETGRVYPIDMLCGPNRDWCPDLVVCSHHSRELQQDFRTEMVSLADTYFYHSDNVIFDLLGYDVTIDPLDFLLG